MMPSVKVRHGYGVGAFGMAICNTALMLFMAKFLVDEAGIEPVIAGSLIFVAKLWDAITDPWVGRLSDRTRSPLGRRRAWLGYGILPFSVSFVLLWQDYRFLGTLQPLGYLAALLAYSTAYTALVVPYGSLTPTITRDYDARTALNAVRMGWGISGGVLCAVILPAMRAQSGTYASGAFVVALTAIPAVLITFWVTNGLDAPASEEEGPRSHALTVFKVPAFRRVCALFVVAWSSMSMVAAVLPFYIQHDVGRPDLEDLFFGVLQVCGLLSLPLVVFLAARWEKHLAYAALLGSWAVILVALAFIPSGNWQLTLFLMVLSGPGLAASHVLPWSILPDVVDLDFAANGEDRTGAFYGAMTFVEKVATAFAIQAAMVGLQLGGYEPGAPVQAQGAIDAVRMVIGPAPAVLIAAACLLAVWWPPVTRDSFEAL